MYPRIRFRRLRKSQKIRDFVSETSLEVKDLVYPIFIDENLKKKKEIPEMPNQYRFPLRQLEEPINELLELKIPAVILFGIPSYKDSIGSSAYAKDGVIQKAIKEIRGIAGEDLIVIADLCLCEYTDHGHCGLVKNGKILNDETLEIYGKIAVSQAEAGADMVAPSGMMDGMVMAIREALDKEGFTDTSILSYAVKYNTVLYTPFRYAAESGYKFGDRSTYQMDIRNSDEAIREAKADIEEGADIIMVKPSFLDIIYRVKTELKYPTATYCVSGEYVMLKAAANYLNEKNNVLEYHICRKRAGADIIITYYAKDLARWLQEK
ncbi:porphobilinogen synthase [Archaeoglobales archaeon]|nr:MAG: porphobilinogen synthase [Archaeoglobales archaeon]